MAVIANRRSVMTLYSDASCPQSHRVRMVLAEKGMNVEIVNIDPDNLPEDLIDLNPYQSVPTDMYSPEFQERRKEELTVRLAQLRESGPGAALREAYRQYADFQCRWGDWRRINADLVDAVARVIPGDHLLAIWQRMLFDPRENRRGFPDLIALGDDPGEYCMVEVKGPGDALQESQKRWLRFFDRQGIPATVAWVSWE